ncbi:DUF262 domain-containing protein [Pontibacter arcticus]|uniref:GmrSD restriction endonucleases N-terminal domain-containing protein n=1 Tax=Pontibacter arcticus TaxID=2080288 RepID=A0A364RF45_9BACT|nr:DUF262 domain-containing protein [Pontibacter arcticus]RAU82786.1 hypothetical protein DP923_05910 [Pontibacter arcticus]
MNANNIQIHTRVRRLFHYIDDFQRGLIRVPAFQREFVWTRKDKIDLFDSIKKGYPIGSILFWRPDEHTKSNFFRLESEKIGSYYIPNRTGDFFYILDGFQRMSTLFGCLVNPYQTDLLRDDKEWFKEFNLVYNLQEDKFEFYNKVEFYDLPIHKVPLYRFVDSKEFFSFQKQLLVSNLPEKSINDFLKKYENLSSKLIDYNVPSIDIIGGTVREAVDIFSRVNSTGAKISDDWKISALSFDEEKNFRLGTEIDKLLEELKKYNFQNIKREVILQCIINSFGKVFFDNTTKLEDLAVSRDFVDKARETLTNIKKAVYFLYNELLVLNHKLLPYNNQLIFITDFFAKIQQPSFAQLETLKRWFWITSYSNYFTIYNLSKQRLAYNKFQDFINGISFEPVYKDNPDKNFIVTKLPSKINLGSVRAKSLALFMLNRLKDLSSNYERIQGYKMLPLFQKLDSSEELASIENTFFMLIYDNEGLLNDRGKDLESWLLSDDDLAKYFISDVIKNVYRSSFSKSAVLELRRKSIIKAEKEFVYNLDMIYGDEI